MQDHHLGFSVGLVSAIGFSGRLLLVEAESFGVPSAVNWRDVSRLCGRGTISRVLGADPRVAPLPLLKFAQ